MNFVDITKPAADGHMHQLDNGTRIGNCLYRYTCKVCGLVVEIDSSD